MGFAHQLRSTVHFWDRFEAGLSYIIVHAFCAVRSVLEQLTEHCEQYGCFLKRTVRFILEV